MSFGDPWGTPFYTGGGLSTLVPSRYPLAIAGREFLLDTKIDGPGVLNADLPVQRPQADTGADPGEGTLSTDGLWRRTSETRHLGAGQRFYDRRGGQPERFDTSFGIDPWTRYETRLLPQTDIALATSNRVRMVVAGGYVWATDGQAVKRSSGSLTTWTTITGTPAATVTDLATDGQTVWAAYGASGVYSCFSGASAMTSYATGQVDYLGYVKGRLMALDAGAATGTAKVYNIIAAGALPAALLSVPAVKLLAQQQPFAEGPNSIYMAGIGASGTIWRTAVKPDGTALDVPVVVATTDDQRYTTEALWSVLGVHGSVLLAASQNRIWVYSFEGNNGDLVLRGGIDLPGDGAGPVFAMTTFERRFVLFSLDDGSTYDDLRPRLGRLDLTVNTSDDPSGFTPGWASDLAAEDNTGTAPTAIVVFNGRPVFAAEGAGIYKQSGGLVPEPTGVLDLGVIGWGIGDLKNALFADVRHEPLATGDSITVEVAADGGPFTVAGISQAVGSVSATVPLGQLLAETIRLRLTLAGNPVLTSVTVLANPAPSTGEKWQFPIKLFGKDTDLAGMPVTTDIAGARAFLKALRTSRRAVTIQHGSVVFTGIVDALPEWREEQREYDQDGAWSGLSNGVQVVHIKTVER